MEDNKKEFKKGLGLLNFKVYEGAITLFQKGIELFKQ